ncbi:uncharacterized protein C8Q71DRAFT_533280 [Rhodofomes roseus]|uniref:Aminoglycoside phosphotransferase domain-containing protein n=1 Tax=Rhodofomes roseus TaxID=34475 RepID=A0ABQ8KK27_9APHY|nr:uncharacterized protein C8Q71DRAFT_533280 [Rhodofomes roseus]KAH9838502.1 hypothetical protein C8Q71DRAFT_533280 [Rhodofomes roseus]
MRILLFSFLASCLAVWAAPDMQSSPSEVFVRSLRRRASGEHVLTLEGEKLKVRLNDRQGVHGSVYKVVGGDYKGAYAKTWITDQEAEATGAAGELLKSGTDRYGQKWIVVKASPGMQLDQTSAFRRVRHDPQQCWALLNHAIDIAARKILDTYTRTHWLHQDPTVANVLFDDHVSQAYLIDWGCASKPPSVVRAYIAYAISHSGLCGAPPAMVHMPVMVMNLYHCPAPPAGFWLIHHPPQW